VGTNERGNPGVISPYEARCCAARLLLPGAVRLLFGWQLRPDPRSPAVCFVMFVSVWCCPVAWRAGGDQGSPLEAAGGYPFGCVACPAFSLLYP
jgi:hypothetical protein